MRILALVTDAFGGYGGIAQYNRDLLHALDRSDRVREIVVMPRLASEPLENVPAKVRQLKPQSARVAYTAASLQAARAHGRFDVIFSGHLFHIPLAAAIGRGLRAPVWLQTHGIDAWDPPSRLVRFAAERSALVTTVSRHTKRRLLSWASLDPERVRVLPNTFRPIISPGPRDDAALARLGLQSRKIILTVARLSKSDLYKGHGKVVAALPRILRTHPDAIYVVVGDGDARVDLEREVARQGLTAHVHFAGRLSDEDVLQLYRSASVFAMPSTKEGFGIVFVEAAATGLPVIAGNCDGSTDALADGVIGTLIDPDDADALVTALDHALSGNARAGRTAAQRFAFENFAQHVDRLIRSLAH